MRLFRSLSLSSAFALTLFLAAHAAPPRQPSPAPTPVDDRVNIEFRSAPDGATVSYTLTEGGWWRKIKSVFPAGLGGNTAATASTNRTLSMPFADGLKINCVFSLAGYDDCKVTAAVKEGADGRRLEVAGASQPLDSTDSDHPAIIKCELRAR